MLDGAIRRYVRRREIDHLTNNGFFGKSRAAISESVFVVPVNFRSIEGRNFSSTLKS